MVVVFTFSHATLLNAVYGVYREPMGSIPSNFSKCNESCKKADEFGPRVSSLCLVFSFAMMRVCLDPNSTARQMKRWPLSAVELSLKVNSILTDKLLPQIMLYLKK